MTLLARSHGVCTLSRHSLLALVIFVLTGCGDVAQLPIAAGTGAHPQLPPPNPPLISTVNIAAAVGWPANEKPLAAPGMTKRLCQKTGPPSLALCVAERRCVGCRNQWPA